MKFWAIFLLGLFAMVARPAPANGENHWHVSTYWAEHIEGHGIGNHALYCGDETIPVCSPPDTVGGVGPGWIDEVEWRSSVTDPSQPVTVRLTGLMNYDLPDAGWDFLELYIQRGDQSDLLDSWTGSSVSTVSLDFTTVLYPGEFSGPQSNEVRLFWRVSTSPDGWDDADCINPSHGACQIDDLSVYLAGALVTFDDFDPGNPVNWDPLLDDLAAVDDVPGIEQVTVTAHPNPFNPQTTISFDLPRATAVSLAVYDLQGQLVRVLLKSTQYTAGRHQQAWDGRDVLGQAVASGTYFYRFTAGRESWSGKLTMLK
jgi:hypothetical protein